MRFNLFVDPRIDSDQILIDLFVNSRLPGHVIPTGASSGQPELLILLPQIEKSILGHNEIIQFLK